MVTEGRGQRTRLADYPMTRKSTLFQPKEEER